MTEPMTTEEKLNAEFDVWFDKLQALSTSKLDKNGGWVGRWFDYYTPEEALEVGPEPEDER